MKKQRGRSVLLKLILIITLAIIMDSYIRYIGNAVVTEAKIATTINNQKKPNQVSTDTAIPQGYIEVNGKRTVFYKQQEQSKMTGQTSSAFVNQSMEKADNVIKDIGREMIKNAERTQKEAMTKLINAQNKARQ